MQFKKLMFADTNSLRFISDCGENNCDAATGLDGENNLSREKSECFLMSSNWEENFCQDRGESLRFCWDYDQITGVCDIQKEPENNAVYIRLCLCKCFNMCNCWSNFTPPDCEEKLLHSFKCSEDRVNDSHISLECEHEDQDGHVGIRNYIVPAKQSPPAEEKTSTQPATLNVASTSTLQFQEMSTSTIVETKAHTPTTSQFNTDDISINVTAYGTSPSVQLTTGKSRSGRLNYTSHRVRTSLSVTISSLSFKSSPEAVATAFASPSTGTSIVAEHTPQIGMNTFIASHSAPVILTQTNARCVNESSEEAVYSYSREVNSDISMTTKSSTAARSRRTDPNYPGGISSTSTGDSTRTTTSEFSSNVLGTNLSMNEYTMTAYTKFGSLNQLISTVSTDVIRESTYLVSVIPVSSRWTTGEHSLTTNLHKTGTTRKSSYKDHSDQQTAKKAPAASTEKVPTKTTTEQVVKKSWAAKSGMETSTEATYELLGPISTTSLRATQQQNYTAPTEKNATMTMTEQTSPRSPVQKSSTEEEEKQATQETARKFLSMMTTTTFSTAYLNSSTIPLLIMLTNPAIAFISGNDQIQNQNSTRKVEELSVSLSRTAVGDLAPTVSSMTYASTSITQWISYGVEASSLDHKETFLFTASDFSAETTREEEVSSER
ncbi:hypothetical protein ANCCEY_13756 [Ancylostoma ceylanicum]|uniref:Uncharacterized protein n=1 Tax=Ancylostoma ceylanicum TaxID=53326 RepID=A0A0D6LHM5_9BILA|nr:hypothetical protein ANCCEY_13756 [Ancylostoma ceylanicum]